MSSTPDRPTALRFSASLTAWFAAFFVVTVIGVFGLSYWLVGSALEQDWSYRQTEIRRDPSGAAVGTTIREETAVVRPNAEMRAQIDRRFRETFFMLVVPIVLLGLVGGLALTHYAARPVHRVVQTVQAILATGELDRRIGTRRRAGGFDDLARLLDVLLERIEGLVRSQRESLDAVAHDLRTPITRLRAVAERAAADLDDVTACREAVVELAEESERLAALVDKLMDVAVAETGNLRLDSDVVPLRGVLDEVVELYDFVAEERSIEVRCSVRDDVETRGDRARLVQVFANLVDNALKYSPDGSHVELHPSRDGDRAVIAVSDQGCGIEPADLPRIWERLYRADRSRGTPGLGLGLSMVRAVVHAHGGTIDVQSAPGAGSTFTVRLPAVARI